MPVESHSLASHRSASGDENFGGFYCGDHSRASRVARIDLKELKSADDFDKNLKWSAKKTLTKRVVRRNYF